MGISPETKYLESLILEWTDLESLILEWTVHWTSLEKKDLESLISPERKYLETLILEWIDLESLILEMKRVDGISLEKKDLESLILEWTVHGTSLERNDLNIDSESSSCFS